MPSFQYQAKSVLVGMVYGGGRALSGPVQSSETKRFSCQEVPKLFMLTCPMGKDPCKSSSMLI